MWKTDIRPRENIFKAKKRERREEKDKRKQTKKGGAEKPRQPAVAPICFGGEETHEAPPRRLHEIRQTFKNKQRGIK